MYNEYSLDEKFFRKLKKNSKKVNVKEKGIRMCLEYAYQKCISHSRGSVKEIDFLETIAIEDINDAIKRIENFKDFDSFWNEVTSIEFLKDNISLLENECKDIDELF